MTSGRRCSVAGIAAGTLLLALTALFVLLDGQHTPDGTVAAHDVVLTVRADGTLHVREVFTFDYAGVERGGLLRQVRYRRGDRLFTVSGVRVSTTTRAPTGLGLRTFLHQRQIRVGAGRPVSGRHAYVLTYDVAGAVVHGELLWDALGPGWTVPVAEASVRLRGPAPFSSGCLAGRSTAVTPCDRRDLAAADVEFARTGLRPREGMTVRAAFPAGSVASGPDRHAPPHGRCTPLGTLALAAGLTTAVALRRRPLPRLRRAAAAAGLALVLTDVLAETVRADVWHLAVGDPAVTGLALLLLALPPRAPR